MERITDEMLRPQLLTLREFRPFKTSDEYLLAMKEDLSDWLNTLYADLSITPNSFMECLETGVILCKHANNVRRACFDWINSGRKLPKRWGREWKLPAGEITYNANARSETFFARDNVCNFIIWCRKLGIFECLLFESDDLILRKNEKNVILCLLEVARRGSYFGMATPLLVQFEKEIDRDIAKDTGIDLSSSGEEEESFQEYGPIPQIITNDLRSLDEMVRELVERCSCPTQFPMIRVSEGKYRIGNTKVMIYVRILRNHVMVRVGGGWDTLAHYLDKHDPCRCSLGHRSAVSSKFIIRNADSNTPRMKVEYERRNLSFDSNSTPTEYSSSKNKPSDLSDSSSEISDEGYKTSDNNSKILMDSSSKSGPNLVVGGRKELIKDLKGSGVKGHQSRKSSTTLLRAQSLSTDEDRPDSRSADDEIYGRERCIMKSSSAGRVPSSRTSRSASCERPSVNFRHRLNSGGGEDRNGSHPPSTRMNYLSKQSNPQIANGIKSKSNLSVKTNAPSRSYSAGGKTDFFSNKANTYRNGGRQTNGSGSGGKTTPTGTLNSGKNTWNGRVRARQNIFNVNFNGKGEIENNENISIHSGVENGEETKGYPELADWIKRALELDSDADKISHIEMAIKQFEEKANEIQTASLPPYYPTSETPQSIKNSSINISKRKDDGKSKIPKPNFY